MAMYKIQDNIPGRVAAGYLLPEPITDIMMQQTDKTVDETRLFTWKKPCYRIVLYEQFPMKSTFSNRTMIIKRPAKEGTSGRALPVSVFDIAQFSGYDGPGIRTVVYFQGCPAACDWCHSPQSQPTVAPLMFNENVCTRCGRCAQACTRKVHVFDSGTHQIHRENCIRCGRCIERCPQSTRGVAGSALHLPTVETTVETLFEQLSPILELTKATGGITLSGGEALLQPEASIALLTLCKQAGIHTAVETSGLLPLQTYRDALPFVDLWLFGLRVVTRCGGMHTQRIEESLRLLAGSGAEILPRIPLVPGYSDRDDVLQSVIALLEKFSLRNVWLNPWNVDFDLNYRRGGFPLRMDKPAPDEVESCREKIYQLFNKLKLNVYENRFKSENEFQSPATL